MSDEPTTDLKNVNDTGEAPDPGTDSPPAAAPVVAPAATRSEHSAAPRVTPGVRLLRALERRWWLRTAFGCTFLGLGIGLAMAGAFVFGETSGSEDVPRPAHGEAMFAESAAMPLGGCPSPDVPCPLVPDGSGASGFGPSASADAEAAPSTPADPASLDTSAAPGSSTGADPGDPSASTATPTAPTLSEESAQHGPALYLAQYPSRSLANERRAAASSCFKRIGYVVRAEDAATSDDGRIQAAIEGIASRKNVVAFHLLSSPPSLQPYVTVPSCIAAGATAIISSSEPDLLSQ